MVSKVWRSSSVLLIRNILSVSFHGVNYPIDIENSFFCFFFCHSKLATKTPWEIRDKIFVIKMTDDEGQTLEILVLNK